MIYTISAILNKKKELIVVDAQTKNYNAKQTIDELLQQKPDVIITLICLPSYQQDKEIINQIKQLLPKTNIIVIGGLVHIESEKILKECKVDFLIKTRFPFYHTIIEYIEKKENASGLISIQDDTIKINPENDVTDLNQINLKAYDYIDVEKYILKGIGTKGETIPWLPVLTGVGCPYGCTYCAYPIAYGKKIFYKDVDLIIHEIQHLMKTYDIQGFCLRDVVFTKKKDRVHTFCNQLIKNNMEINYFFETRIGLLNEEMISLLKKTGCFQMNIGVESGSPEILKNVGKPGVDIPLLKQTFDQLENAGINTMAHIILGLPGESKKTIKETYQLLKTIHATEININYITPYPGTPFYDYAKEHDLILDYDWSHYTSHEIVMRSEALTKDELLKQGKQLQRNLFIHKLLHNKKFRKIWIKRVLRSKLKI